MEGIALRDSAPGPLASSNASCRTRYEQLGDVDLVRGMVGGDTEAVGAIWDRYSSFVRGVVRMRIGVDTAIEDLVQEVFVALLHSAARIRDATSLRPFLASISMHVVSLELRKRRVRRWVILSPTGAAPEETTAPIDYSGAEVVRALYRVLERVPKRRRRAFELRYMHEFEIAEVAKALDISESTVKRELLRAREFIFACARREPALAQYLEVHHREPSGCDIGLISQGVALTV